MRPGMTVKFDEAGRRHWDDAEFLHGDARLSNADQLYGLSAECALKALAVGLGWVGTSSDGDLDESRPYKFKNHVNDLWSQFQSKLRGLPSKHWSAPLGSASGNPFADWLVAQRYAAAADVPEAPAVGAHRVAAMACQVALERWALDAGAPLAAKGAP